MPELAEVIGQSDEASRPAAGIAGRLWDTTDASPPGVYRDDGGGWVFFGTSGGLSNPMTDAGDIIIGTGGGSPDRLGIGPEGSGPKVINGNLSYYGVHAYHIPLSDPTVQSWTQFNASGSQNSASDAGAVRGSRTPSGTAEIRGFNKNKAGSPSSCFGAVSGLMLDSPGVGFGIAVMNAGLAYGGLEMYYDTDHWVLRAVHAAGTNSAPTEDFSIPLALQPVIFLGLYSDDDANYQLRYSLEGRMQMVFGSIDWSATVTSPTKWGFYYRMPTDTTPTGHRIGAALTHWVEG